MHEFRNHVASSLGEINEYFTGMGYVTDYDGRAQSVKGVRFFPNKVYTDVGEALGFCGKTAYYGDGRAVCVMVCNGKQTKAFKDALERYQAREKEYKDFDRELSVAYKRTSEKVTCPMCRSMIATRFGRRFKACPVCGSEEIISKSNWETLKRKKRMVREADEALAREAKKSGVQFAAAFEWHC